MISPARPDYAESDDDVRLMLAVSGGSDTAFEELLRKYETPVLVFLQMRIGNRHQAEDLLQEVFLRVFRARHTYRPTAKFSTWLTVIARNVAANATRKQSRGFETTLPPDEYTDLRVMLTQGSRGQSPSARLERSEVQAVVRSAIDQLCPRQRQAVVLQGYDLLKYDQIALAMDTSPKAVKSLLARARDRLREELRPCILQHIS